MRSPSTRADASDADTDVSGPASAATFRLPDGARAEIRRVVADGVDTAYAEQPGDAGAPVVVLVPGGALDTVALTWSEVLVRLPASWRVVVPDLPGYGASGPPRGTTTADTARWLGAFLDALGLGALGLGAAPATPPAPVVLAGSSMGAAAVLTLALDRPDARVAWGLAGVVVSGAYGLRRWVTLHPLAAALVRLPSLACAARALLRRRAVLALGLRLVAVHRPAAVTDDLLDDARAALAPPDALDAFAAWLRTEIRPDGCATDLRARLPTLAVPLLAFQGRFDRVTPGGPTVRALRAVPRATLVSLPTGHLPPREAPETVTARLRAFVETVTAR